MRKNKMMRLASALLVAVLLTTCAISGTFAKYVTEKSATDTARVAYWGFGHSTLTIDMFDGTYTNVKSNDTSNVVAPGTRKDVTVQLQPAAGIATPEVAYTMNFAVETVTADTTLLSKLVWYLNGTKCGTDGTFNELKTAVAAHSLSYDAGELPGAESAFTITWEWPYYESDAEDTSDTELGDAGAASLEVKVTILVTQVD